MNAKVILYLFGMEWRRLRIWLAVFWLFLLLEALPHLAASFDRLSGFAMLLGRQYHHYSGADDLRLLVRSDLGQVFPQWMSVLMSMNGAAVIMAIVVSSLIGMEIFKGIRLRPVRVWEEVASKICALGVFVILPVAALVALNLSIKGFNITTTLSEAALSGLILIPTVGALALFGRLCGSFWRWVGGMVGFYVLVIILTRLGMWYVPIPQIDLWGRDHQVWRAGAVVFGVLVLLMAFRGNARSFRPVVIAWPLMVAALTLGFYADKAAIVERNERYGLPDVAGLEVKDLKLQGGIRIQESRARMTGVSFAGDLTVQGVPEGYFVNWQAEGRITADEKEIRESFDPGIRATLSRLRFAGNPQQPRVSDRFLERALRAAMQEQGMSLPRSPDWNFYEDLSDNVSFTDSMAEGKEQLLDHPVDVKMAVAGLVFRYRLAEDMALNSVRESADGRSRVRITPSVVDATRANVDLAIMQTGDPADQTDVEPQVVIWDPESGLGTLLVRAEPIRPRLLAGGWFRLARYRTHRGTPDSPDGLFQQMNHSKARVLVYMPEILGLAERRMTVGGVTVRKQDTSNWGWDGQFAKKDGKSFFERYPEGRPDPETCNAEEAGRWVMRVLAQVPLQYSEWSAREIACFVPRHGKMLLRFPKNVLGRWDMSQAFAMALSEEEKEDLLSAVRAMEPGYSFNRLYDVARTRGWEGEVKEAAIGRINRNGMSDGSLPIDLMDYEDRSKYPELIARLDGERRWGYYLKLRELPGIEPALSEAIANNEMSARRRGETEPEAYAIAAAHGSRTALRMLLSKVGSSGRVHYSVDDASQFLFKATYVPSFKPGWPGAYIDRVKQIGADGFDWDPFLRLWIAKQPQP